MGGMTVSELRKAISGLADSTRKFGTNTTLATHTQDLRHSG